MSGRKVAEQNNHKLRAAWGPDCPISEEGKVRKSATQPVMAKKDFPSAQPHTSQCSGSPLSSPFVGIFIPSFLIRRTPFILSKPLVLSPKTILALFFISHKQLLLLPFKIWFSSTFHLRPWTSSSVMSQRRHCCWWPLLGLIF